MRRHEGDARPGATRRLAEPRPPLYTPMFLALCLVTLLGFSQSFMLQPILPLFVLDLGGDALVVGLVFAVFSIPSIVLRPIIGQLGDRWGLERIMLLGGLGTAIAAVAYLVPSLIVLLGVRVVHGISWAGFSTGATSMLARIAPPSRRLEASGLFDLMPSIASLVMPAVGLILLHGSGFAAPFLVAAMLAGGAVVVSLVVFRPHGSTTPRTARSGGRYLEASAVLPMLLMLLFTSASSLFLVYPPLLAQERGIPIVDLAIYYPAYGIVLAVARALTGRLFERVPRSTVLAAAAVIGAVGLLMGATADSLLALTLSAAIFAVAYGIAPPTTTAVVMERAPSERIGQAMATYTLGFQIGSGLGAAVWGVLVGPAGFGNVFVFAAAIQGGLFVLAMTKRSSLDGPSA